MHTKPMPESDGDFSEVILHHYYCRRCEKETEHEERVWESSCGGYEDYKYTCKNCGLVRWVDGPDS